MGKLSGFLGLFQVRRLVAEWVCFNTVEPGDLDAVRPYYPGVEKVAAPPKFHFPACNRDSGAELAGKLV